MMALATSGSKEPKTRVCLERLSMKFVEAKLQKLIKLTTLHKQLFSRVADFELSEF